MINYWQSKMRLVNLICKLGIHEVTMLIFRLDLSSGQY
jgi:hypothetical protein